MNNNDSQINDNGYNKEENKIYHLSLPFEFCIKQNELTTHNKEYETNICDGTEWKNWIENIINNYKKNKNGKK